MFKGLKYVFLLELILTIKYSAVNIKILNMQLFKQTYTQATLLKLSIEKTAPLIPSVI